MGGNASPSLSVPARAAARGVEQCRCHEAAPFDEYAAAKALSLPDARRFYDYVTSCGGGAHTDGKTLDHLYDIWRSLGSHGS